MSKPLTNPDELLLRQIHPNSYANGIPASDRFRPSGKDEGMLSVDRGSMTSAARSHGLYTSRGLKSAAVFGVTLCEFQSQGLNGIEDPIPATDQEPDNPFHALMDFNGISEAQRKLLSKRLCAFAIARGRLHPPT
jgi:hypothetical protein